MTHRKAAIAATRYLVHEMRECITDLMLLADNGAEVCDALNAPELKVFFLMSKRSAEIAGKELDAFQSSRMDAHHPLSYFNIISEADPAATEPASSVTPISNPQSK